MRLVQLVLVFPLSKINMVFSLYIRVPNTHVYFCFDESIIIDFELNNFR